MRDHPRAVLLALSLTSAQARAGTDEVRQLIDAVTASDQAGVSRLLSAGADPDEVIDVRSRPSGLLSWVWRKATGDAPVWTSAMHTAFHRALRGERGGLSTLRLLLDHGADPDTAIDGQPTLLAELASAVRAGSAREGVALGEALLAHGADPNGDGADLPLVRLAGPHDAAVLALAGRLLQAGGDADRALCGVAPRSDGPFVALLLPSVRRIDGPCADGRSTPLIAALGAEDDELGGIVDVVDVLLAAGAGINVPDAATGLMPIGAALGHPSRSDRLTSSLIRHLLGAGAARDALTMDGQTLFELAGSEHFTDLVSTPLTAREQAAALLSWSRGTTPDPTGLTRDSMWTPALLQRAVSVWTPGGWLDLFTDLGPVAFRDAPRTLGVLVRQGAPPLDCAVHPEITVGDLATLLGRRTSHRRSGPFFVDTHAMGGGTVVTWQRIPPAATALLRIDPAPASCSPLAADPSGRPRAAVLLAMGPPDLSWEGADGWYVRKTDAAPHDRPLVYRVEHSSGQTTRAVLDAARP